MMKLDRSKGAAIMENMWGPAEPVAMPKAEFSDLTVEYLFSQIWSRPGLGLRDRSMITVASLASLGRLPELRSHILGALENGVSAKELEELMIHLAHYAGWPVGNSGLKILAEVLADRSAA